MAKRFSQYFSVPLLRVALLLIAIAPAMAASEITMAEETPRHGGTLKSVVFPEPPMLLSAFNSSTYVALVSTKIHEGLLTYDFDMTPQPALATAWQRSEDGLTYTFHLRKGVKWHDGEAFTSADVRFSLTEVWAKLHPRGRATFANVTAVKTPDAHTIVIELSKPNPTLLLSLSSYESQVVAKHVFENTEITRSAALTSPIGTGPFKFVEWQKGNHIILERNPDYWDAPKPYLEQIVIRFIPDASARANALETGEVDYGAFTPVPIHDIERLAALDHLAIETRGYEYLSPIILMELNHRNKYLANVKVRQALSHAINRAFIVENIWFGFARAATGPIPSTLEKFYDPDLPDSTSYDPQRAERLLDEAGFPRGEDGVRFRLRLEVVAAGETFTWLGMYTRQLLRKIGIEVELRNIDLGGFIRRVYTDLDFDVTMNLAYTMPDPSIGVQRLYWSGNIKPGVPFHNVSSYSNPELDRLLVEAQSEIDPERRQQLWRSAQRIIARDVPVLNIIEMKYVTLFNKKVKNHTISAEGPYASFADVYLAD